MGQVQKSADRSSIQTCVPYVGLDLFGVHFNNLGVKNPFQRLVVFPNGTSYVCSINKGDWTYQHQTPPAL